jgi:hypothetical protein
LPKESVFSFPWYRAQFIYLFTYLFSRLTACSKKSIICWSVLVRWVINRVHIFSLNGGRESKIASTYQLVIHS